MADLAARYTLGRKIGEGAFGAVYICSPKSGVSSVEYALKVLGKEKLLSRQATANLLEQELQILMHANHPNIVRIFDIV